MLTDQDIKDIDKGVKVLGVAAVGIVYASFAKLRPVEAIVVGAVVVWACSLFRQKKGVRA